MGTRKVWIGELLGAVRMALLPSAYLDHTVGADPLVRESVEATHTVLDAGRWSRLRGAARAAAKGGCASGSTLRAGAAGSLWWWAEMTTTALT